MSTVTIGISNREETKRRVEKAFRGEAHGEFLSFESVELMWKVLSPRRWDILQAMTGKGPMSLRRAARLVERDVKTTHGDVHALLDAGLLEKGQDGKIQFPYDAIHVDFTIEKAG
jgi:predicted transcriptional regulator